MIHILDENFIVAICFIIFIYLSYRPVKKAILSSLDSKIEEIKQKLAEAEKLKFDAKNLLDQVEKEIDSFEERKKSIIHNAQNSTNRFIEVKSQEIDFLLARKKESTIKSIENEATKASNLMRSQFVDVVLKLVKEYLLQTNNSSLSDKEVMKHFIEK